MHIFRIMQLKRFMFIWISCIFVLILVYIFSRSSLAEDFERSAQLKLIDADIRTQADAIGCKQPFLPVYSPEIMKFVKTVPKIDCSAAGSDWVKCLGSECTVQEEAKNRYGSIKCSFTDVLRLDDHKTEHAEETFYSDAYYKLEQSDVVFVSCKANDKSWSATLMGTRMDKELFDSSNWDNVPHNSLKLNVLMFGFDSLSRNSFIRKLPKSYEYLTKILGAIVLQSYNIVGDGTPQALIPILTGKTELELPDTRKRLKNTKFVNSYPFIWNDYKDAGYITAFFEDVPELSTFTYRLNGFDETPTDHYMRPYYLAALPERRKWPKLCTGEIPRHKVMLNAIQDFFTFYKSKPKFLFGFHGELSHDDYNLVGVADDDLLEFLTELKSSGTLDNTLLILMADHGHRFAEIRNTMQGKQEERLPFFSFTFPEWFKEKHKQAYKNFKSNEDKLATPFDIFKTLQGVLDLDDGDADISKRSVSLFTRIPEERSCSHAYIEPHWCACLDWQKIPISDPIVERLGEILITTLNNFTRGHRDMCETLSIAEIFWVTKMAPNQNLIKFNKNADLDGFVADLSAKMKLKSNMYQIKVMLKPGNSLFEASVTHFLDSDKVVLKMSDISRINMYGSQARCVENEFPHLRKYCYCKD